MSSPPLLASLNPSLLVGPAEAGILANAFLTGAFFVQSYIYFTKFSEDKWPFKVVGPSAGAFLKAFAIPEAMEYWPRERTTLILVFVSIFVSDVWISSTIAFYLWTKRKGGNFATNWCLYLVILIDASWVDFGC
ncbi:hypothetical protein CONPUDRAFT_74383 [Coniophora puteana RWD-64-598 SS2]|uniref:Uncharacterized protein n=1 Tax=Coniophora puteana (strain RWD-64-598) TaxID=741705 RepID=A0A5M3MJH4_CONPW|nr:uncharacterized protein CONPUDRAFT_74383 [Coniophora puteana RWD-64-598 SS2]EIW78775.1 hypothetical protein CONPUDRAFT_74383 [Coniophora puteana RWD-64-598 SS2]